MNSLGIGNSSLVSGSDMFDEVKARKASTGSAIATAHKESVIDSVLDRPTPTPQSTPSASPTPAPATQDASPKKESSPEIDAMNKRFEEMERRSSELSKENQRLQSEFSRTQGSLQAYENQMRQRSIPAPQELPMPEFEDPDLKAAFHAQEQRLTNKFQGSLQQSQQLNEQYLQRQQKAVFKSAVDNMRSQEPTFTNYFTDDELMQFASPYINNPRFMDIDWGKELGLAFKVKDYDPIKAERDALKKELQGYKDKDKNNKEAQKKNLTMVPSGIGTGSSSSNTSPTSAAERVLKGFREKGVHVSTRDKFRAIRREMGLAV